MKTAAVIAEYNPFHNGHAHQLNEIRRRGYDQILILMSGDYVQRGECAILDKYTRAKLALIGGADAVVELPTLFACSSAEYFAEGAISLLHAAGCIDALFCGAENDDMDLLERVSDLLIKETPEFREGLNSALREGASFPSARSRAIQSCLMLSKEDICTLSKPNNILALEYLKAIKKLGASFPLKLIPRNDDGYHGLASAEKIRELIKDNDLSYQRLMPEDICQEISTLPRNRFAFWEDYRTILYYSIQEHSSSLCDYLDMHPDLSARILNNISPSLSLGDWISHIKSRNFNYTRISRALLHVCLGIKKEDGEAAKASTKDRYLRLLGFRKETSHTLLNALKNSSIPLISKPADYHPAGVCRNLFELDLRAADLYESMLRMQKENGEDLFVADIRRSPIVF